MYAVVITDEGGVRRKLDFSKPELTVGRVQGNDIVLAKRNVSKQHARLTLKDDQAVVMDLNSTNGTWVNGRKITSPHPLKQGDKIYIADFILTLEPANDAARAGSARIRATASSAETRGAAELGTDSPSNGPSSASAVRLEGAGA
jgi:pilus assembly protein CpaF